MSQLRKLRFQLIDASPAPWCVENRNGIAAVYYVDRNGISIMLADELSIDDARLICSMRNALAEFIECVG